MGFGISTQGSKNLCGLPLFKKLKRHEILILKQNSIMIAENISHNNMYELSIFLSFIGENLFFGLKRGKHSQFRENLLMVLQ